MGLRVGIVTGNHVPSSGGAWTFSETLSAAIKAADSAHTFVVLDDIFQSDDLRAWGTQPAGTNNQPTSWIKSQLFRRIGGRAQRNDNANHRNDSANHVDLVWLMMPWGEPLPIPYIATVWDLEHRKQPYFPEVSTTGWTFSAREKVYNALLPRASMIITGTQAGKDEVVHYYRVNPTNVMVNPLPVPAVAPMAPKLKTAEIREKYGLRGDFLLYPAQFWPHKNHVNLLKALKILRDQSNRDLSLVLTGSDKGNQDHVMKQVVELGLSGQVFVLGFVPREDLDALYRTSMALAFPSYFGPDNLPPLEAFALDCPVIAANIPGAKEQLGDAALLFEPSDPSNIASKIESVCCNPDLRAQMIARGNEIARLRTPQAYIATLCSFLDRFEAVRRCWA